VKPDDALVELPRSACICIGENAKCPFPDFVNEEHWDNLVGEKQGLVRLALALLFEKNKGTASTFHPYIQQLPKEFFTLTTFSKSELKELQYPPVLALVEVEKKFVQDAYRRLRKECPKTKVAVEEFEWAMHVVNSRVFSGQLDPKLKSRLLPKVSVLASLMYCPRKLLPFYHLFILNIVNYRPLCIINYRHLVTYLS
jgi:hypothetical protein